MSTPLPRQVQRMELVFMAYRDRLEAVRTREGWPAHDIEQKEAELDEIRDCLRTMQTIAKHADAIRDDVRKDMGA